MFKVASFNTNSVRARLEIILDWIDKERPDVLCLQETKVQDENFPLDAFAGAGYRALFKGQKSYNGVALLTPQEIEVLGHGSAGGPLDGEPRLLAAGIKNITVVNTYVPHGRSPDSDMFKYKLHWLESLGKFFKDNFSPDQPLIWAGDFNIAPEPIDVYDPDKLYGHVCYHPEEHRVLQGIKEWGLVDVFRLHVKEGGHYTFWDYRVPNVLKRKMGWRIDHIWATPPLARLSTGAWIDTEPRRRQRPSDHTFIVAEFDL